MILGTAAKSSTAVEKKPRKNEGHNSVKKTAIPIHMGAAIPTAITDVKIDPKSGRAAPNTDSL